jgi:hypothetical protein
MSYNNAYRIGGYSTVFHAPSQVRALDRVVTMSDAIVRWTLSHAGRTITCTEQLAPHGLDVQVTYDSLPLASQHCDRMEDAVRWSDELRMRWEASGWSQANRLAG